MLSNRQALEEAQKQQAALITITRWRNHLMTLSAILVALAYYFMHREGQTSRTIGIVLIVLTVVSVILMLLVGLSVQNGRKNVERILDSLKDQMEQEKTAETPAEAAGQPAAVSAAEAEDTKQ